jgi:uncharacterized membrane protein
MKYDKTDEGSRFEPEPRWPAFIAIVAIGGLYTALPPSLIIGPRWAFFVVVILTLIPTYITHRMKYHSIDHILGFAVSGIITAGMIASVVLLIIALPQHTETPGQLLTSAALLWTTNVLVFALWYWRLDAGGPHHRDKRAAHTDGAFLFPQMTLTPEARREMGEHEWSPNFFDYLYIAFNTSTAFSPTDTPVLARWGKVLMMVQSVISLTVLALLAARAVNIL